MDSHTTIHFEEFKKQNPQLLRSQEEAITAINELMPEMNGTQHPDYNYPISGLSPRLNGWFAVIGRDGEPLKFDHRCRFLGCKTCDVGL